MRNSGKLECYKAPKGGICYERISRNEQMAIWKHDSKRDEDFILKSLNGKQIWREFGAIITRDRDSSILIRWHHRLVQNRYLMRKKILRYEFVEIAYDKSQHSSVENISSDSLSLHLNLLSDLGEVYRQRIVDMIARCDKTARYIGQLASDLFLASGGDTEKTDIPSRTAREKYYYEINVPFRKWLASLDADDSPDVREQKIDAWCREADAIAHRMAEKMVRDAGQPAFIGKMIPVGKEKKKYYSSSLAMKWFRYNMKNIDKK